MLLRLFLLSSIGAALLAVQSQNSQSWLSPSATSYLAPAKAILPTHSELDIKTNKAPGEKRKVHLIHLNESKILNKNSKSLPSSNPKMANKPTKTSSNKNRNLTQQARVAPSYLPPNHRAKAPRRNALQKLAPTRADKKRLAKKRALRMRRAKQRAKAKRLAALKRKRARARARARKNSKRYYYPRQRIIYWY